MTQPLTHKRYLTLNDHLRARYGRKVFKVPLDAGFTCPNKDGTAGTGGCVFCSPSGSGDYAGDQALTLREQFDTIRERLHDKWPDAAYIPYFQANTNTYADLDTLRACFDQAVGFHPDVVAIAIATRPDALENDVVDYLDALSNRVDVTLELGLQSMHDETGQRINRGHDLNTFDAAVMRLAKTGVEIVVHIINGLPGETPAMMLDTIKHLNTLPIHGVKIHMLHVMKRTALGEDYEKEPFPLLDLPAYVDIVVEQLRHLRPDIVVHRVTGDSPKEALLAPAWTLKKFVVMNEIDKRLRALDARQGDCYKKKTD